MLARIFGKMQRRKTRLWRPQLRTTQLSSPLLRRRERPDKFTTLCAFVLFLRSHRMVVGLFGRETPARNATATTTRAPIAEVLSSSEEEEEMFASFAANFHRKGPG